MAVINTRTDRHEYMAADGNNSIFMLIVCLCLSVCLYVRLSDAWYKTQSRRIALLSLSFSGTHTPMGGDDCKEYNGDQLDYN